MKNNMTQIKYPKIGGREISPGHKALFRSLIPEIRWLIKDNKQNQYSDNVLIHNLATIFIYRMIERDKRLIKNIKVTAKIV